MNVLVQHLSEILSFEVGEKWGKKLPISPKLLKRSKKGLLGVQKNIYLK